MREKTRFIIVTHGAFFLTGIVTTMLGPLLPELIRVWSLTDGQAGALFMAQSLGSLAGIVSSSRLLLRIGFLRSLALGSGLMFAGVAGLTAPSLEANVIAIVVYGIGLGITIPSVNLLIADRFPERRAAALNLVNLAWCIGAVVSPPIIAWCLIQGWSNWFLRGLAALIAVAVVSLLRERRLQRHHPRGGPPPRDAQSLPNLPRALIALLLFLYVATEIGTAGWIPTYAQRLGLGELSWSWLQTTFWASILVGRAFSPGILRRLDPPVVVLAGLFMALLGETTFLASEAAPFLFAGAALTGLGLATIYPTTVATFSEFYGDQASARSMPIFAMASLGGALGPWIVGLASEQLHSLQGAMGLLIVAILVMLGVQAKVLNLWKHRSSRSHSTDGKSIL